MKIRAIAILKKRWNFSAWAYLLFCCGISSIKSLSLSTPYELERKIGRLERNLDENKTVITFALLKEWIKKASQTYKSIWNFG